MVCTSVSGLGSASGISKSSCNSVVAIDAGGVRLSQTNVQAALHSLQEYASTPFVLEDLEFGDLGLGPEVIGPDLVALGDVHGSRA